MILSRKRFVCSALIVCFISLTTLTFAQKKTVQYIGTNGRISTPEKAIYKQEIQTKNNRRTHIVTFSKTAADWEKIITSSCLLINDSTYRIKENSEKFTGTIIRTFRKTTDGLFRFRDEIKNAIIREGSASSVIPLLLHGSVTEFYRDGTNKSISEYRNNELISNQNWKENGEKYLDNIFYSVDIYPQYNPGNKIINQKLIQAFQDSGIDISSISGTLKIGFVVMENGTIEGLRIIQGLGNTINTAAYQTFSELKENWSPAKLNDQTVRYYQVFPVNFIYRQHSFEFAEMRGSILHYGAY